MAWHLTTALLLGNSVGSVHSALSALYRSVASNDIPLSMAMHSDGDARLLLTDSSDGAEGDKAPQHNHRHYAHHTPLNSLPPTTSHASTVESHHAALYLQLTEQQIATAINARICLGLDDIFIALFLVGLRRGVCIVSSSLDPPHLAHGVR